jgi:hypothetical protein
VLFLVFDLFVDIIYIAGANANISSETLTNQFVSLQNLLAIAQGIVSFRFKTPPRLWLVTKNATYLASEDSKVVSNISLLSSPIWGFGASVCLEHPELNCKRVDLDSHQVWPIHRKSVNLLLSSN